MTTPRRTAATAADGPPRTRREDTPPLLDEDRPSGVRQYDRRTAPVTPEQAAANRAALLAALHRDADEDYQRAHTPDYAADARGLRGQAVVDGNAAGGCWHGHR